MGKRDSIEEATLTVEKPNLAGVSFRDELAESAQRAINGPPAVVQLAPTPAPKAPRKAKAPEPEEEEFDFHVTTAKLPRHQYLALYDIAVDRIRNRKRGSPNLGEVIREAVAEYLEKR